MCKFEDQKGYNMFRLGKKLLIFDGAMGSEIEKRGFASVCPEELNITNPDVIQEIHRSYHNADFITTNTFGLNRIKYKGSYGIEQLCKKAISNARTVDKPVFFDIGPTGALLAPLGNLDFDEAYDAFAEVVRLVEKDVDGFIAETFSDLYEMKACVLAVKENSDKPLFATMTFDKSGRTLTGSTPEIMTYTLEGLGVDALGVNCSLGPDELGEVVDRILMTSHIPVIVQPNRGLPELSGGKTVYSMTADEFADSVEKFVRKGVSVIGGCCGTTPEFIDTLFHRYGGRQVPEHTVPYGTFICSYSKSVSITDVTVCGERLNPTGKKKVKEAIVNSDFDLLVDEGISQIEAGADLLDVNVGIPKIDEPTVMKNLVKYLQEYISAPLQLDSSDPVAIEAGARYYNGIPLINSVSGKDEVMRKVFPIVKKYGAIVIGLTLDENGIPDTAEERAAIAEKIIKTAESYGICRSRVIIDTLVLTASAEQKLVNETLRALTMVRKLGVKTALGVSNVSYGLPERSLLNRTFLVMALNSGLSMPIMNPLDRDMVNAVKAFKVLKGIDSNSAQYIAEFTDAVQQETTVAKTLTDDSIMLSYAVKSGLKSEVGEITERLLKIISPIDIINNILIKSLEEIGKDYETGKIFLPQLMSSAEAAKTAFDYVSSRINQSNKQKNKATIVVATVRGDIHDIGKNIVKTVLESYGFCVIDLGKDTPVEKICEACNKYRPLAVGLSALMTTTVPSMENTIKAVRKVDKNVKIIVGGAVLTAEIAESIGADFYAKDALATVSIMNSLSEIQKN